MSNTVVDISALADETSASMRRHREMDPRLAVNRVLREHHIRIDSEVRSQVLGELGKRGARKRAERRRLGLPPKKRALLFATSLFDPLLRTS